MQIQLMMLLQVILMLVIKRLLTRLRSITCPRNMITWSMKMLILPWPLKVKKLMHLKRCWERGKNIWCVLSKYGSALMNEYSTDLIKSKTKLLLKQSLKQWQLKATFIKPMRPECSSWTSGAPRLRCLRSTSRKTWSVLGRSCSSLCPGKTWSSMSLVGR